nr:immunoglobulin heavy chain junction region [Macaca mulatta]MOX02553.1 immunoglobulin heavy chain junction region [Macaca mulatta]
CSRDQSSQAVGAGTIPLYYW